MTDAALPSLDLREQIVRIDRAIAETHRFQSESDKLQAEGIKLRRDATFAPWQATVAMVASFAALSVAQATPAKSSGWL